MKVVSQLNSSFAPEREHFGRFVCAWNLILFFAGYPFFVTASAFLGHNMEDDSQGVTIIIRAFFLAMSIFSLFYAKKMNPRTNWMVVSFFIYWLLFIARVIYDLYFQYTILDWMAFGSKLRIIGLLMTTLFAAVSLFFTRDKIDFRYAMKWIVGLVAFSLFISLFSANALYGSGDVFDGTSRVQGNAALNTISYGQLGGMLFLLSLWSFLILKKSFFFKLFLIPLLLLGGYILLKAGSRGPLLAVLCAVLSLFLGLSRYPLVNFFLTLSGALCAYLSRFQIVSWLGVISPELQRRMEATLLDNDTGGREFELYWSYFTDNPLIGTRSEVLGYSHNIVIDAFMGMGLLGGVLMIVLILVGLLRSFNVIHKRGDASWINVIFIQCLVGHMTSGAFFMDPLLSALWILILLPISGRFYHAKNRSAQLSIS